MKQALDIARQYKAKVYILHVIKEHIYYGGEYYFTDEMEQIKDNMLTAARASLQKQLGQIPRG